MKKLTIILLLLILCSCSLLKRNNKTTDDTFAHLREDTDASALRQTSKRTTGEQTITIKDSTGTDYTIRFWPKGKVYLLEGGELAGEFDSIRMTGRQNKLVKTTDQSRSKTVESTNGKTEFHQKQNLKSGRTSATKLEVPDVKVILIIVILPIVLVILYKYLKK